jgi:hypothetical protein
MTAQHYRIGLEVWKRRGDNEERPTLRVVEEHCMSTGLEQSSPGRKRMSRRWEKESSGRTVSSCTSQGNVGGPAGTVGDPAEEIKTSGRYRSDCSERWPATVW